MPTISTRVMGIPVMIHTDKGETECLGYVSGDIPNSDHCLTLERFHFGTFGEVMTNLQNVITDFVNDTSIPYGTSADRFRNGCISRAISRQTGQNEGWVF